MESDEYTAMIKCRSEMQTRRSERNRDVSRLSDICGINDDEPYGAI